ncbi:MAG: DUF58 domain-containing protein [Candidatus Hydrogenedentota bacterium]
MASLNIDPAFFRRLERLALVSGRLGLADRKGERRAATRGTSIEFADFREYHFGDDLRFVDWNACARLDKLFIKLFHEETSLRVHLLIDNSASMDFGSPNKLDLARRLAAALSYIALSRLDEVTVSWLGSRRGGLEPCRGQGGIHGVIRFLNERPAATSFHLSEELEMYSRRSARNALAVVVSDFLDADGIERGVRALLHRKYQVSLVQILSPEELNPHFGGDLLLEDSETGATIDVTASPRLFERYRQALLEHNQSIEKVAREHGLSHALVSTATPDDEIFLRILRARGVVR